MANFTTTRAYKLKLSGPKAADEGTRQGSWRRNIWNTHYIVNRGVWVWGDWLLSLRGGLPAILAKESPERRVILALSWLSVEAPKGLVPEKCRLTEEGAKTEAEKDAVVQRFKDILQEQGVDDIEDWIDACEPALRAKIRPDAVWVDRWSCFQDLRKNFSDLSQEWAARSLFYLLGKKNPDKGEKDYFSAVNLDKDATVEEKEFPQAAINWLSYYWGTGKKSDPEEIAYNLNKIASIDGDLIDGLPGEQLIFRLLHELETEPSDSKDPKSILSQLKLILGCRSNSGSWKKLCELAKLTSVKLDQWKSVCEQFEKDSEYQLKKLGRPGKISQLPRIREYIEEKIGVPFRTCKDLTSQYAVILDHALRRLSSSHTWIKRAEAERAKFTSNAKKMNSVIAPAREWLNQYCEKRFAASGAGEPYIIRKNAIECWSEIKKAWNHENCRSVADRKEVLRQIQNETEKKFGDAALFLALAEEDAEIVWHDKKHDHLSAYSAAQVAQQNQTRFKVPAYRHPDPLRHPVWVDFGNSRWDIEYAAQSANQPAGNTVRKRDSKIATKQQEASDTLRRQQDKVEKAREALAQAKSEKQKETKDQKLQEELCRLERYQEQEDWLKQTQGVELDLWTGEAVKAVRLHWSNKRLVNNLALDSPQPEGKELARADRLGRAVGGWPGDEVMVAALFSDKQWPGRLQSDRRRFDRWADKLYGGKQQQPTAEIYDSAELKHPWESSFWQHLPWYLSYSATLEPHGPMFDPAFAKKLDAAGWVYQEIKGNMVLYHPANKKEKRSRRTRLQLPLIDGLRVLSFDLGLRFAASCAVWHVFTENNLRKEIAEREITYGGLSSNDLFVHTSHTDLTTEKLRKTIYRRLSPTMWARLDRQFTIKLPGEEQPSRKSTEEIAAAIAVLEPLGVYDKKKFKQESGRIADLQAHLVQQLRRGLRRHGDLARAANALQATSKPLAGGRTYQFLEPNTDNETVEERRENYEKFLADGLVRWYRLIETDCASNGNLKDLFEKNFGNESIALPEPNESPIQAKRREKKLAEQLLPIAQKLAGDRQLREELAQELTLLWKKNDLCWQGTGGYLRKLRRLIIPRLGKKPRGDSPEFDNWQKKWKAMQNVGGLSLQRISTMRGLYQLLRAYYSRPEPEDLSVGIRRIESDAEKGFRFGMRILNAMEGMRENRVKQLASRIIEAALGVGSENRSTHFNGRKRPNRQIFEPCQIIVGEDLQNYRPDQKQLRAENRNVQQWCARNVRDFIIEGCQLYGLHFDEAPPQYTSLQDSRTGAPGLRCRDMTARTFLETSWLKRTIERLRKKQSEGDHLTPVEMWLIDLQLMAEQCGESDKDHRILRFASRGADLFVSADGSSPAANGLQADLNAAANIGLRNLLHPDWAGSWSYLPVQRSTGTIDPKKLPGSPLLSEPLTLLPDEEDRKKATSDILNAWSDPSASSLTEGRDWRPRKNYVEDVESRVIKQLRKFVEKSLSLGE